MTTISKQYGFPTGNLNLAYFYLKDHDYFSKDEEKRQKQVIQLVKDFGYPDYICTKIAQEIYCSCADGTDVIYKIKWENDDIEEDENDKKQKSKLQNDVQNKQIDEMMADYQEQEPEEKTESEHSDSSTTSSISSQNQNDNENSEETSGLSSTHSDQ